MDVDIVDHYAVLGVVSGEEGSRVSCEEIKRAYRLKAREVHPDKRHGDPDANAKFVNLNKSYEVLMDEKARKLFDDLLLARRKKLQRQRQQQHSKGGRMMSDQQQDSKRRRMISDLEERERRSASAAAFAFHPTMSNAGEKERIYWRTLNEEVARIRAMHTNRMSAATTIRPSKKDDAAAKGNKDGPKLENLVGVEHEEFENSVMRKLKEAAQRR